MRALVKRGKEDIVVPCESVESTCRFLDYIGEDSSNDGGGDSNALGLYFDSPFERKYRKGRYSFSIDYRDNYDDYNSEEWEYGGDSVLTD